MATYLNDLRLKEITTGDEAGTWGTSTNTNLSLIADAFSLGTKQMAANANETFTMPDATADGVRSLYLKITSAVSLTVTRTVTLAPNTVSKVWIIENATTGGQSITIAQGSGATVTVPNGQKVMIVTDGAGAGAAVTLATPTVNLASGVTGTLPVANGGTGITSLGAGVATFLGTPSSANLAAAVTNETGSGALVFATSPTLVTPALGTPSSGVLTNATGLPISTGVSGLGTGVATFLATPSSANLAAAVTNETGSGALVFATSPTLVTPALGTPSALVGTNITGTAAGLTAGNVTTNANLTGAITSTGNATSLGSFTSANLAGALTDETGSGAAVFATSPTLVTPILGTPQSGTLTNATGLPIDAGTTGTLPVARGGTGTATPALVQGANITITGTWPNQTIAAAAPGTGTVTSVGGTGTVNGITLTGTVTSSGNLTLGGTLSGVSLTTQVTGTLPVANGGTGITSFGAGIATFLGTPTSANLAAAVTNETGSGALVFATSPTLVTPALGTPSSATLTNATGLPIVAGTTGTLSVARGGTGDTSYTNGQLLIGNTTGNTLTKGTLTAGTGISITNGTGSISIAATNNGTVTSVGGTGTVNGITLTGTVTSSGSLTLGGTLSGVSLTTQVTGTLPVANGGTGITSFGTGVATFLGTPSSANLAAAVTDETGSGALVFATSPTLVTPALGTPSSATLTNATGLPTAGLVDNAVTNAKLRDSAALSVIGRSANSTGDPADIAAGSDHQVFRRSGTSLGFGAIALNQAAAVTGTLPVANGGTGVTTSTGTGNVVLSTSPTLVTPALGTPSSATLTNATGLPIVNGTTGTLSVARGGTGLTALGTAGQALVVNSGATALEFANASSTNVQIFTSSGTWTKPAGVTWVIVEVWGAGGGGGGGCRRASGTDRSGGGGGGGGAYASKTFSASDLAGSETVTIGAGGAGGAAGSADNTDGGVGANGGTTTFSSGSTLVTGFAGARGAGGVSGTTSIGGGGGGLFGSGSTSSGGAPQLAGAAYQPFGGGPAGTPNGVQSGFGGGGGGRGGTTAQSAGGASGWGGAGGVSGNGLSSSDVTGGGFSAASGYFGSGGAGGTTSSSPANATSGGAGAIACGGGGGGSTYNGFTAGAGGNGGNGYARITSG